MSDPIAYDDPDFKMLFELYYPVIAEARKVRDRYSGKNDGVKKVCPDETGAMIEALNAAEGKVCVVQNVEDTNDAP